MKRFAGLLVLIMSTFAIADVVVPVESVESHVNIRMLADSKSEIVGRLNQGDHLPLVASTAEWHEVEIAGGATGYISADWAVVLDEPPAIADDVDMQTEAEVLDETLVEVVATDSDVSTGETSVDEIATIGATITEELQDGANEQTVLDESLAATIADESVAAEAMSVEDGAGEDAPDVVVDDSLDSSNTVVESSDELPVVSEEADAAAVIEAAEETTVAVDAVKENTTTGSEIDKESIPVAEASAGIADPAESVAELPAPVAIETESALPGVPGLSGPQGPPGIPGPPGPAGAATIEGSIDGADHRWDVAGLRRRQSHRYWHD